MKKTILKVFLVIAVIVLCFLAWRMFFSEDGIMRGVYDGIIGQVNTAWHNISGSDTDLIPEWNTDSNGTANEAGTGATDD